jgi:hypothetical protein
MGPGVSKATFIFPETATSFPPQPTRTAMAMLIMKNRSDTGDRLVIYNVLLLKRLYVIRKQQFAKQWNCV